MKIKPTAADTQRARAGKQSTFVRNFKRDWQLHLLLLIPVILVIIFDYWPMYGAQIAFREYRARDGIWGSKWVGLKWFRKFFESFKFEQIVSNTVVLSLYNIIVSFFLSVILALLLNSLRSEKLKKFTQNITYVPHFISTVVLVAILNQVFSPVNGLYGTLYRFLGGRGYPYDFRATAGAFRHLYVWSGMWQNLGWQTIVYTAALSSVSNDQHEAAMIDGASRWKRILHVDLPALMPTACIMLILKCGSVMSLGFEKAYLMQSNLNLSTSEIISTYVYKVGMGNSGDFSYATAIDLFNSAINCSILIFVNWLSNRLSSREVGLF